MKHFRLYALLLAASFSVGAQNRISSVIDDSVRVVRRGNVHPLARPEFDRGPAGADLRMDRMMLVLSPTAAQQSALTALLAAQLNPASASFHQWMSPEDFGREFGVSDRDLDQITGWLTSQGFQVEPVDGARNSVVFSGSAGQVGTAFHTSIHVYNVRGQRHYANATDPELPQALAEVVQGVVSLHNFPLTASPHTLTPAPQFTYGSAHYLVPADFATIYDATALYNNSIDGRGQAVAVVARTNFNMSDVTSFRSSFGLPVNNPTVVLNGTDPGIVSESELAEALLDVEWSGAVAKGANVQFVLSASTNASDGVALSAQYIVNHNVAPVLTLSFGSCELGLGTSGNQFWNALWQQAAAQGITALVAAGDSGAAGCDNPSASTATYGRSVNGLCSSPYSTCVGGLQFVDTANPGNFWAATNNATTGQSALSYIPEAAWNQSGSVTGGSGLWAGGGGASAVYSKPVWQTGPGVPADGQRDVPDVSLSASTHDGYLVTMNGQLYIFGGTSAATPSMAGLMTLVAQKTATRQGNANPNLYALANRQVAGGALVFHDITTGNNTVPGATGFTAGPGYDGVSGLGSVDAALLVNHWSDGAIPIAAFQVTVPATASVTKGASHTVTAQVTVSGGFSGSVALSVAGAPAGLTASFTPGSFAAPGSGSSTLTLAAGSTAVAGTYNLTVNAVSGSVTRTAPLALTIVSNCSYSLSATSASVVAAGGSGSVNVITGAGCAWTSASNASWIGISSATTAASNGAVNYLVAKNTATSPRSGTLTIAGATFTVTQAAGLSCTFALSATGVTVPAAGGTGTVNVASGTGCPWAGVSNANWINVVSGASGTANGTVQFSAAKNTVASPRTGTLTIAGATFTVSQQAGIVCTYALSASGASAASTGGGGSVNVTSGTGCTWTSVTNVNWINVLSGGTGLANGMVQYSVAPNTTANARVGTVTIAGATFTVTQAAPTACTYMVQGGPLTAATGGVAAAITVTAANGCTWTAVSNTSWITIKSGAAGTGNGSASIFAANNTTGAKRQGTFVVAGTVFTFFE